MIDKLDLTLNTEASKKEAFKLQTNSVDTQAQSLTPAQVIRALFEGTILPKDVSLTLVYTDVFQDGEIKESCQLPAQGSRASVQTVCDSEGIHDLSNHATQGVQVTMNSGSL